MQSFSERMGLVTKKEIMQKDDIDQELRIALFNVFYTDYLEYMDPYLFSALAKDIYISFLNKPSDEAPSAPDIVRNLIKNIFLRAQWNVVYDFIQFSLTSIVIDSTRIIIGDLIDDFNRVLEQHMSFYRFINYIICPISSEEEISTINEAMNTPSNSFNSVKKHLNDALIKISNRENPDYRNSIKESISAVECFCKIIANDDNASLGKALELIKSKGSITIHPALNEAFNKLYGYTSNEKGIRHSFGLLDEENKLNFEEAKFMLVSCSAFINFLMVKASKADIDVT
jgi:hypothetical protein